ncbi:MAG: hypothetical protein ORN28_03325 [Rhodoferax sp.]|nr:hypothetical protein [Rhodoferax sp.]
MNAKPAPPPTHPALATSHIALALAGGRPLGATSGAIEEVGALCVLQESLLDQACTNLQRHGTHLDHTVLADPTRTLLTPLAPPQHPQLPDFHPQPTACTDRSKNCTHP